mgnify:CR=1 FL=1
MSSEEDSIEIVVNKIEIATSICIGLGLDVVAAPKTNLYILSRM